MRSAVVPRGVPAGWLPGCLLWVLFALGASGQEALPLVDGGKPAGGWKFGNGPEFPGARGTLELAAGRFRGEPVLSLTGDFTGGGNYVEASVALPDVALDSLSLWIDAPAGRERQTIRLVDGSGQCHQLRLKIDGKGGWQQVVVPVVEYFRTMGMPGAPDIAAQYEKWGGANDGRWHQPGRLLVVMVGRDAELRGGVRVSGVRLQPACGASVPLTRVVGLDEMLEAGETDWEFNAGQEFPGAVGGLDIVPDQPRPGGSALRLRADFTGGGAYVGMRRSLADLDVRAVRVIRAKMRSDTVSSYGLRLVDGSGQCHQRKGLPFDADGAWHEVEIVPARVAGGEHWGGADDGAWHEPVRLVELMLNTGSDAGRRPELMVADLRAEVEVEGRVRPAAFAEGFDAGSLPAGWQVDGAVRVDGPGRGGAGGALLLERPLESLRVATRATGPAFDAAPGPWRVGYAWQARLHSPDDSYHGGVDVEALDRDGAVLDTVTAGIGHGERDWQEGSRVVVLPAGTTRARFRVELRKTYGSFRLDELSAAPVAGGPIERRIERIKLATPAVGNLFLPGEPVGFEVTVEASKSLPPAQRSMRWSVRDYWGAGQSTPAELTLERAGSGAGPLVYTGAIEIPAGSLEVGRYYELHVAIGQAGGEPVAEYSGFAILPPAVTRQFAPARIPFTIRNWDSRVPAYIDLADRLGLRQIGLWGGWSAEAPYEPECPGLDHCRDLGAAWITGTPAANVERNGFGEYSEEALRSGMKRFLERYADRGLAMVCIGNEPHGTGGRVVENVRAYRAIYETVKEFDPGIHVVGTSVEPNEEYFRAGYQDYLDSYDFHIYEHYSNVRRTIREYRALMEKYHAVKPIHSTELGLNSQGQTRHAVAVEMVKKFTVFFAEGGSTVSWFTIQYPDPEGRARGQSGDSHCVFDCKYNLYNPRLDAITCYHLVNGICDKRFVGERQYPDGVQAYLFRDARGGCLQVMWLDGGSREVFVPLAEGVDVDLLELDGARTRLGAARGGVSLTVSDEPVMLFYPGAAGAETGLAPSLGEPALRLAAPPDDIDQAGVSVFALEGAGLAARSLRADAPPGWEVRFARAAADRIGCTVRAPASTAAREARIHVDLLEDGRVTGRLRVPVRVARPAGP